MKTLKKRRFSDDFSNLPYGRGYSCSQYQQSTHHDFSTVDSKQENILLEDGINFAADRHVLSMVNKKSPSIKELAISYIKNKENSTSLFLFVNALFISMLALIGMLIRSTGL
ncbi:MAG: hypothetical protein ACOYK8_06915 [Alphaproteobacteria bacterium]